MAQPVSRWAGIEFQRIIRLQPSLLESARGCASPFGDGGNAAQNFAQHLPCRADEGMGPAPGNDHNYYNHNHTDNNKLLIINWIILGGRGVRWPLWGAGLRLRHCADLVASCTGEYTQQ